MIPIRMPHGAILGILVFGVFSPSSNASDEKPAKAPNLYLDVSSRVINTLVKRSIDETERFTDEIQDTPVAGVTRTIGASAVQLIPNANFGIADVVYAGKSYSRSVGYRPHTLLYTSSETSVEVRRRVVIDNRGLRVFILPPRAQATTTLDDVRSYGEPDLLAQRVAGFFFERNKGAAEAEAAAKTAQRISKRIGDEMTPLLAAASKFGKSEFEYFKGRGLVIDSLDFHTTQKSIQARLRMKTPPGIVLEPRPAMTPDLDVGLLVHPSLLNEAGRIALSGREFPITGVKKFYDEITLGLLQDGGKNEQQQDTLKAIEKVLADLGGKQTLIVMAKKDPLTITATADGFVADIHVGSIRTLDTRYVGMHVRARYRIENTDEAPHAVREGAIEYLDGTEPAADGKKFDPLPFTILLARNALFEEILKKRLALVLPQVEAIPDLRFYAPRGGVRNGWMALAWTLRPAEKKKQDAAK